MYKFLTANRSGTVIFEDYQKTALWGKNVVVAINSLATFDGYRIDQVVFNINENETLYVLKKIED